MTALKVDFCAESVGFGPKLVVPRLAHEVPVYWTPVAYGQLGQVNPNLMWEVTIGLQFGKKLQKFERSVAKKKNTTSTEGDFGPVIL